MNTSHIFLFLESIPNPIYPSDDKIKVNNPLPQPKSRKDCNIEDFCSVLSNSHKEISQLAIAISSNTNFMGSVFSVQFLINIYT